MMKRIIILAILALAAGCQPASEPDTLLSQSEISLTWKGVTQLTYSSKDYQMAFNDRDIEYRVYDDNLTNWFIVKCSQKPMTEGETVVADVSWTGEKSIKSFTGKTFKVAKTDEQGHVWLQNSSDKIGIIIKNVK